MNSLINDQVPSSSLPSKGSGSTHNQTTELGGNKGRGLSGLWPYYRRQLSLGVPWCPARWWLGWTEKALSASPQWRPPAAGWPERMATKSDHSLPVNTLLEHSQSGLLSRVAWFDMTGLSAFLFGGKKGPTSPIRITVGI